MAASNDLEKYHCLCRAVLVRANRRGVELHCDRCRRRHLMPFAAFHDKASFERYWREWHEREKRT